VFEPSFLTVLDQIHPNHLFHHGRGQRFGPTALASLEQVQTTLEHCPVVSTKMCPEATHGILSPLVPLPSPDEKKKTNDLVGI